jgi:hypothetical protein
MYYYDIKTKALIDKNCSGCQTPLKLEVELIGGCGGHWGEDDRCYCDSPDVRVMAYCPNWTKSHSYLSKKYQNVNHVEPFIVAGMTDRFSLERTLVELLLEQT